MEKRLGYGLLIGGIVLIIFSAISMVLVLTKNAKPVQFYAPGDVSIDFSSLVPDFGDISRFGGVVKPQETTENKLMSDEALIDSLNLLIHMFLMGFLINVGSKIAVLGSNLVRPIVVKLNKHEHVVEPIPSTETKS